MNNISQPCTVLMPVHNGSRFLDRSIKNIKLGLRDFDEFLIVNDGSNDLTFFDFDQYARLDPRIRIVNRKHSGLVDTLNFGISIAKNEFIARADVDDLYAEERLELQSNFLSIEKKYAAVFCDYQAVDEFRKVIGTIPSAITPRLTELSLINSQRTPHPGVMFRKSMIQEVDGYFQDDYPAEDLSLWMRLASRYDLGTIPKTLLFYTVHRESITMYRNADMTTSASRLQKGFVRNLSQHDIEIEAKKMFSEYKKYPYYHARRLLMIYDLMKYQKNLDNFNSKMLLKYLWCFKSAISLHSIYTIFKLLVFRFNLKKLRS